MKKKICWVTADYFLDHSSIVDDLSKIYEIEWIIVKHKDNPNLQAQIKQVNVKNVTPVIVQLKHSFRNVVSIIENVKLIRKIRKNEADLIYLDIVGFPYFHILLYFMSYFKVSNVVIAAHNVIDYEGWPNRRAMKKYTYFTFIKYDNFQLFSNYLKQYFDNKFEEKNTFFAPLGLIDYGNNIMNKYDLDESKRNFLFFGNVKPNKKLELLIKSIKSLPYEIQEKMHLTIAGNCDDVNNYFSLIGDCKSITCYFKRIPDNDIPELFLKHDFLLLPYENVAQSGPHMIAYNYNLPVIASDIDGFSERIVDTKTGFLFKVNDEQDLKENLIKAILMSENDYKIMKTNLQVYVDCNYSVNAIIAKYKDFFNIISKG